MKKSGKIPLQSPVQVQQVNYKIKVFLNLLYYVIALAIIYFSNLHYQSVKPYLLFKQAKVKNLQSQLHLLTDLGLFFSIFVLFHWILIFIISSFRSGVQNLSVSTLKNVIIVSLEHFIIFFGIFSYSLINQRYNKKQLILILNWFCLARIISTIGSIIDIRFKINLKECGGCLSMFTIIILLLNVGKINVLNLI